MKWLYVLVSDSVALFVAILSTMWVINASKAHGLTGKDINKVDKPDVPLLGGVGIVAGFVAGSFALLALNFSFSLIVEPILLTSLLVGFLGVLDDFLNIRQSVRAFTPLFAAVPISLASLGHSTISIPFVGPVNFGLVYYVLVVPAALTITSNAFNMLEGLNGLSAGMGIVMAAAFAFIGLRQHGYPQVAGLLSTVLIACLVGFLVFNRYPAKVFPGNVGTYFIGALLGALGISGYMLTALAVLYVPYVLEFVLKARTKFRGISFGIPQPNGKLSWTGKPQSLTHIVMKMGRFSEPQVVGVLWGIELIFALIAVYLQTTVIVIR
ncbi:UDP-N-acetylglucosamine--dolichyl-phosphate N-acetylglucosaminephosphotransferase [Sulfodiicoccus acidiphilus]|uniref:UDP-N-acetylglucosamine--dolichyl-phosphate N-acetylglucosaminephosphotransferase n=1 Tax=Sulfodiicoccus acidiphilus TaxID=1670455 RepID=A0A348B6V5_9CREN|nr:glycosyltransferase 4 family protein [Sulfodiicoccus acidiphilus]BBD73907.1 UDP-N-acetylglucosamine--dolichyl-phosphate N-acetylglucosaminephosphotransferase [Sulfodiicoccus acidiphilus]GGT95953.1 UDP-N-acetylglucosamine--dolichyl-phosphate N-acetylglucosaminephosphotransferase [Sulfodiicoccus acidiphilus]